MSSEQSALNLIAIIHRLDSCRQYPFFSMQELTTFCNRKPYSQELLKVTIIRDARPLETIWLEARSTPGYVATVTA